MEDDDDDDDNFDRADAINSEDGMPFAHAFKFAFFSMLELVVFAVYDE